MINPLRSVLLMLILCGLQSTIAAMSFDEYQERVDRAVDALDGLLSTEGDEFFATSTPASRAFREMREALPSHGELQWNDGVSAQIDNSWLDAALKDYEKLSVERATNENRAALESIAWRLRALDERLLEFERAAQLSSDDPDHARLNAILERMKKGRQQRGGGSEDGARAAGAFSKSYSTQVHRLATRAIAFAPQNSTAGGRPEQSAEDCVSVGQRSAAQRVNSTRLETGAGTAREF
ncbi:MAG: hypothetical protein WKF84_11865 [Pyrinomonadaceae bacterium]